MRYAFISDVHSNLEALTTILADLDKRGFDRLFCLGDVVGYGGSPNECVDIIRERAHVIVQGNHDRAVFDLQDAWEFNEYAETAVRWTRDQLRPELREYLGTLPLTHSEDDIFIVHASPDDPAGWWYVMAIEDAALQFGAFTERLCFHGHTHIPRFFAEIGGAVDQGGSGQLFLIPEIRYLINVGSVGQPRDRDPRASYLIYDSDHGKMGEVQWIRLEYDIAAAQETIRKAGLPEFLAQRLERGA